MSLSLPTTLYIYYHENYLGNLYWIWRRIEEVSDYAKTLETQAILKVYNEIPEYSTRQMRKNITNKYSLFTMFSPSIIYPDIICDLRVNNGFKGTKFDNFWDAVQEYFSDVFPAVHERCTTKILVRIDSQQPFF
ncbi:hypothetical protein RclHR1_15070005 [Rhizophagus clarus]|nr:hypothetical protein RclHR1_15070005 [Rhizophagus clarus]